MMDLDLQLSQLLGSMTLQGSWTSPADLVSSSVPVWRFVSTDVVIYWRKAKEELDKAYATLKAQDECMSDASDTEDFPYQARCPSPLFFSTPLLTFDDLDLISSGAGGSAESTSVFEARIQRDSSRSTAPFNQVLNPAGFYPGLRALFSLSHSVCSGCILFLACSCKHRAMSHCEKML